MDNKIMVLGAWEGQKREKLFIRSSSVGPSLHAPLMDLFGAKELSWEKQIH